MRSGLLYVLLGEDENVTPTDQQLEVMASIPVDGTVSKDEMLKRIAA